MKLKLLSDPVHLPGDHEVPPFVEYATVFAVLLRSAIGLFNIVMLLYALVPVATKTPGTSAFRNAISPAKGELDDGVQVMVLPISKYP
jgi:hypothetical protein